MPLAKPESEDLRKLHAEVNQILNQRFILTTTAITIFGAILSSMVWVARSPVPAAEQVIDRFEFTMATVLSCVLFGLYLLSHSLIRMARTITSYLIETKSSVWEIAWQQFHREPYWAYTKPQAMIFMALNFVGAAFPFLHSITYGLAIESLFGPAIVLVVVCTITEIFMFLMAFTRMFENEEKVVERWKRLNAGSD